MEHGSNQYVLEWSGNYSSDWKNFGQGIGPGIRVAGISSGNRSSKLLTILDKPGFNLTLEKEPDNPVDSKAVKVIAHHEDTAVHIGYLPAGMGKDLQDEPGLAAIPQVVFLPHDDYNMGMEIKVLVRSARWRKKNK